MMWLYIAKKIIKIFIAELYTILYIIFYYTVISTNAVRRNLNLTIKISHPGEIGIRNDT